MQGKIKKIINNSETIYPITVSDAVYVEKNKNLKQKLEELRSGIEGSTTTYVIELGRWGIVRGSQGKPPYTLDQWALAYNNILGINKALAYANNNGFGKVVMPRGTYSFCYTNFQGLTANEVDGNIPIMLFSNQTFDLNGSTFETIFDSINKNPYDLSPANRAAWRLNGRLIQITDCYNTHVINGMLVGDIPNRSFSDGGSGFESEQGMEGTYGIMIDKSSYCSAENIDSSMFMGDGIGLGSNPRTGLADIVASNDTCAPGYLGNDGTVIARDGAYISPSYNIDPKKMPIIQMRTGGGYTRIPEIQDKRFSFIFLGATGNFISIKGAVYLQRIAVPYNATTVRVQFENEAVGLTSLTTVDFSIGSPQCNNIKISSCKLHDNHRGGLSGGADYTLIEFCQFYQNGLDSGIGVPLFPDSTRYAIDFEDSYSNYLMLENNEFSNGFNGVLLGVYHARVVGNIFSNISGVIIYNNASIHISENTFYDAGIDLATSNDSQERNIFVTNNVFYAPFNFGMDTTLHVETKIKFDNNIVYLNAGYLVGNIDVTNNYFGCYSGDKFRSNAQFRIEPKTMIGNTFENFVSGDAYSHKVFVNKKVGSSQTFKSNIYKSVTFQSEPIDNDAEFMDSHFFNCYFGNPPMDRTKSSSISFVNCELIDSSFVLGQEYVNNLTDGGITIKAVFDRCKILLTESFAKSSFVSVGENKTLAEQTSAGIVPRKYEMVLNKSTIDNRITSKTTSIFGADGTLRSQDSVINLTDSTKVILVPDNAGNLAIVEGTEYIGFTTFISPTGAKLQTYMKSYIVRGSTTPVGNKDNVTWVDTTNNKAYWWNGTAWADAMGVVHS